MCYKCRKWIFGVPVRVWYNGAFRWFHEKCKPVTDRNKVYG